MGFNGIEGAQGVGVREQRHARLRTKPLAERDLVFGAGDDDDRRSHAVLIGKVGATNTPTRPQANCYSDSTYSTFQDPSYTSRLPDL